jgi:hypothetical protein
MFDPDSYISDSVVLRHEGTVALQSEGGTTGTVFAIPNAKDTIRYFEIHVELNRGGIFVGTWSNNFQFNLGSIYSPFFGD